MIGFGSRRVLGLACASGLVVLAGASFGLAQAASSPPGAGIRASAASCVGLTPAQQFKAARVVLVGVMLPGRSWRTGELLSPAKVRVIRFLKGHGPSKVQVQTAIQLSGNGYLENADGIDPRAGQRWKIYSDSNQQPYSTSVCAGSRRIAIARIELRGKQS